MSGMIDAFRGEEFVRECPEGAVIVEKGQMPSGAQFLYRSAEQNDVAAIYSVKSFAEGGISVLKDGVKYKRISPMAVDRSLLTDENLLRGVELGVFHEDPVAVPLGLMRMRGALVEWEALCRIGEQLDKDTFKPPITPAAVIGYPNLRFKDGRVASLVHRLENVDFDLRFTELIAHLLKKMRGLEREKIIEIAPLIINFFINLNRSRGANAKLMYDLGILPCPAAMVSENYSLVGYGQGGGYGLFFHDHDSTILGETCSCEDYCKRLDFKSVPKIVLALAFMMGSFSGSFVQAHDFLTSEELRRKLPVSKVAMQHTDAFVQGFQDYVQGMAVLPGELDLIKSVLL